MKRSKMFNAAFKALKETDIKTTDDLSVALNTMFSSLGLPVPVDPHSAYCAACESDLSFDAIKDNLDQLGIDD